MNSGIRQGCAVSTLLFILAVEFMALEIKNKDTIKGIQLFTKSTCIVQYADDTTLTLLDHQSITEALKIVKTFSGVSGLELNMVKCEGIWLGPLKGNNHILFEGIKFSNGPLQCLGIYIGTDKDMCKKKNWENKLHEINNILSIWSSRNLKLFRKVVIINNLIIPKLIYNMTVLPFPPYVIQGLEDLFYKFLWGKTHKIVKSVVIAKCENGGLNLTDMNVKHCALKSSWFPKFLDQHSITEVLNMYLSSVGLIINLILKMNFRKIESFNAINKIPIFYQQIFLSYNMCKTLQ